MQNLDRTDRDAYIVSLRDAGWTLQAISEASGLSRERVRQVCQSPLAVWPSDDLPVPTPPAKPVKARPVYVEPDPADLRELIAKRRRLAELTGAQHAYKIKLAEVMQKRKDVRARVKDGVLDKAKLGALLDEHPVPQKPSIGEYRTVSAEVTELIRKMAEDDGVPHYRIAKRAGITHAAVRQRMLTLQRKLTK